MIAETGTGLFRSLFCRSLEGDPHRRGDSALRQELLADLPKITDRQGEYQPVYGLGSEYESSPRLQNLLFDCTQVTQFFAAVEEKRQIRLLDVGCNIGYTALKLAEVFPNIVGVDLDSVNIDFATRLSAYTGSSARFECLDFLKAYDSGTLDFINVDCILLFNVAHQFVFTRGIEYTKELIRAITEQVDVTFFELAHKHEYASHQKDHLLPDNPQILLSNCRSVEIEVLKTEGRPLIRVARKHACFGPISMQVGRTRFSNNPNHSISRKYYENTTQFLKLFRFTPTQSAKEWGQELRALLAIRDSGLAPTIREFAIERDFAAILMEKLDGAVLTEEYARFSEPESLRTFLAKYLAIAAKLGESGLFHNDLSAHNLWVLRDDRLVAIDFEQADERSFIDPFAVMLWTIYDILKKRNFSYDRGIYKRLYNDMGIERADKSYYPDFSAFSPPLWLSNVIARAETSLSWFDFLRREPLAKIDNVAITPRVDSNIASPQASPAENVEAPGSPSFVADIVRASFCAVLGRPPGPGGLSAYSKLFENVPVAVGVERAVQGLLGSEEFQDRWRADAQSAGAQAVSTRAEAMVSLEDVTVCMIVLNEEEFLPPTLAALKKHFRSFVITDMGSSDGTLTVVQDHLGERAQIVSYSREELLLKGYSAARNFCAAFAQSPWILFVDADEVLISEIGAGGIPIDQPVETTAFAAIEIQNLRKPETGPPVRQVRSTVYPRRLHRKDSGIRWSGYIHEELTLADDAPWRKSAKASLVFDHFTEFKNPHRIQQKREMYFWMLLHAYQNAQLQVGTNSYWYDKFVPENLQAIETGANAFESSKRLGSNEPCGPTGEVERPHAGE